MIKSKGHLDCADLIWQFAEREDSISKNAPLPCKQILQNITETLQKTERESVRIIKLEIERLRFKRTGEC